ncbi:MAG: MopE-related protein [Myxococcota bacterium]
MTHWTLAPLLAATLFACNGDYGDPTPPEPTGPTSDIDGDGFSIAEGDCDDEDSAFYPGANDVAGDAKDQNCDGADGLDDDGDGHASIGTGGDDCDDAARDTYLGAPEVGWDDIDQDCDGDDRYDFEEISVGKYHTCALDTTGVVKCFGGDEFGQISLNQATEPGWKHVCSGFTYSCASHEDGTLLCWGSDEDHVIQDVPTDFAADQISCGDTFACALDGEGVAVCWGDDEFGQVSETPTALEFTAIAAGAQFACAVSEQGGLVACWGDDRSDQVTDAPPITEENFVTVQAGLDYACAIRQDLGLRCWGEDNFGQSEPTSEAGPYSVISGSHLTGCGILEAKELSCWGQNAPYNQVMDAPTEVEVHAVSIGHDHGCAIKNENDELICWGNDLSGQATVPW